MDLNPIVFVYDASKLWYNPKLFGTAFVRLAHKGRMPEPDMVAMRVALCGTVACMPFFSFILGVVGCRTAGQGSLWGLSLGVFFDGGINLPHSFFEDRPFALFLLHRGYHVISLTAVGAILGALCGPSIKLS